LKQLIERCYCYADYPFDIVYRASDIFNKELWTAEDLEQINENLWPIEGLEEINKKLKTFLGDTISKQYTIQHTINLEQIDD